MCVCVCVCVCVHVYPAVDYLWRSKNNCQDVLLVISSVDTGVTLYLRDGIIYALGVQDCYSIGFDTIQVAVKIADGLLPGDAYPEMTEEITTIIYQDGAAAMLRTLYGVID